MIKYENLPRNDIVCIDMKSFYASCECVRMKLDPMKAKVAVVGDIKRNGSVVLASSPMMKKIHKIKTGSRLFEIQKINDPEIIVVQARMGYYYEMSRKIVKIFEDFVPPNHIHVYSVDESWLNFFGTQKLWGDVRNASKLLLDKIKKETGIIATVGIGDNKFLAKFCLDNYGKDEGIAEIRYEDVVKKVHPLKVESMWGIGERMRIRLNEMGIYTIRDLAQSELSEIKQKFGKNGETLYNYSWGIDLSPVVYDDNNPPPSVFGFDLNENTQPIKSAGRSVTLLRDYTEENELILVMRELVEEVCEILRKRKVEGRTIHLSMAYSKNVGNGGFSRQKTINNFTSDIPEILEVCKELYETYHEKGKPVRKVGVSIGKLKKEEEEEEEEDKNSDFNNEKDNEKERRKKIQKAKDLLNEKYGKGTVRPASSLSKNSVAKDRIKKVNGHFE